MSCRLIVYNAAGRFLLYCLLLRDHCCPLHGEQSYIVSCSVVPAMIVPSRCLIEYYELGHIREYAIVGAIFDEYFLILRLAVLQKDARDSEVDVLIKG